MGFKQIMTSLHKGLHPYQITSEGIKFNQPFKDSIYDGEDEFRSKVIVQINDVIGIQKWAIEFTEFPVQETTYFADIYADNVESYYKIVSILQERIKDVKLQYYYKGDVSKHRYIQG